MAGHLEQMYAKRRPLYEAFSDFAVENSGTPEETAEEIMRLVK